MIRDFLKGYNGFVCKEYILGKRVEVFFAIILLLI